MPTGYGPLANGTYPEDHDATQSVHDTGNFATRASWITNSKEVELIGKFYIGAFSLANRYILNKVNIVTSLHRSHDNFVLCRLPTSATNYKVKLIDATLAMKRYQPSPTYLAATESHLKSSPALYPYL